MHIPYPWTVFGKGSFTMIAHMYDLTLYLCMLYDQWVTISQNRDSLTFSVNFVAPFDVQAGTHLKLTFVNSGDGGRVTITGMCIYKCIYMPVNPLYHHCRARERQSSGEDQVMIVSMQNAMFYVSTGNKYQCE